MKTLTVDQAARVALAAQGFGRARPAGKVDARHFRTALSTMGLLQLDSVNVLVRSHYLPMFSRLGGYDRSALDQWTSRSGELFEYWGHMASLIPVSDYALYRWRMDAIAPWKRIQRLVSERPDYIENVHQQVVDDGPITVGDLEDAGERTGPWWGYAPGKLALEWLFDKGRITAYRNRSFTRLYDDPTRVIAPSVLQGDAVDKQEAQRTLLLAAARHHGIGTVSDLADYHRIKVPAARPILKQLADEGELDVVAIDGWKGPAYLDPRATLPRRRRGTALLSPFDPLVWNRDRIERLFDFRYRIEIYVPKEKRVFGYYVLPFLYEGRLVGRVDLKLDRERGRLLVRGTFHEDGIDPRSFAPALANELKAMAAWLDADEVEAARNGNGSNALRAALSA